MIVVSTGFNPPPDAKALCLNSVHNQTLRATHVYIDAARQSRPRSVTENLARVIRSCPPLEVVVWLDLDDSLAHPTVLQLLDHIYEDPDVWLTYGSYRFSDGRPGHCAPYETTDYRREPWKASHLRTFRAGLFQRIRPDDLITQVRGRSQGAPDQAVMLPMLEMAGPEHIRFIPEILAIYNYASSFEHGASPEDMAHERLAAAHIRTKAPYARLEAL